MPVYIQANLYLLENVKETSVSRLGYGNNCSLGKWESRLVIALIYVVNNFIQPLLEKEPNGASRLLYKVKKDILHCLLPTLLPVHNSAGSVFQLQV